LRFEPFWVNSHDRQEARVLKSVVLSGFELG
jgi:hypothetical protein